MKRMKWLSMLLAIAAIGAAPAIAHEGHSDSPGTGGAAIPTRHVLTAVSDRYEVVLKNDPLRPGMPAALELFVSDYGTNAPIQNAAISLSVRSDRRGTWTGAATPTKRPGIFAASFQAPADTGSYTVLVSIAGAKGEGRFALSGLEVSDEAHTTGESPRPGLPWLWISSTALLAFLLITVVARRRMPRAIAAIALCLLVAPGARAHEGHDNAPTSTGAPVGPNAEIYIAKESQFLLGILTEAVKLQPVQRRLAVLGRIAPRGGGDVEIVAPQSGRISFPEGRPPVIGQRLTRGEPVARLTVVDDLDLRAPITGVLTGVFVVNGQLVQAGQRLMTLLDPSVVWVHADVYEADIARVQRATRAVITSQSMPDVALNGRRVAMGVTQGEVPGAVEAWFEVPNVDGRLRIGSLVDVGIEEGGADSTLVISRSAVFEKDGRKLVFVHTAPERFTAREVVLGASLGARVAVTGALNPGDRVVAAGGYPLLTAPVIGVGR